MPGQETPEDEMDRRSISVLASGHAMVDACQGAVPALLPFLISRRGYSYAEATSLLLVMTICSSLLQPLFGYITDRRSISWLLPGGVLAGGLGIAMVGLVDSHTMTLVAVGLAGLGVGAYHPEGARNANYVAGTKRRATAMSFYGVGGNIGFAIGPVLITLLVLAFGLDGIVWFALPMTIGAIWLASEMPRIDALRLAALGRSAAPVEGTAGSRLPASRPSPASDPPPTLDSRPSFRSSSSPSSAPRTRSATRPSPFCSQPVLRERSSAASSPTGWGTVWCSSYRWPWSVPLSSPSSPQASPGPSFWSH